MTAYGEPVSVVEEWRGRLWSERLHRVVVWEPPAVVTFEVSGSLGRFTRYLDASDEMTRDERKMLALQTGDIRVVTVPSVDLDCLRLFESGRWAHVSRGYRDGRFLGWYVDFGLPPRFETDPEGRLRIVGMDLVLDALVSPDGGWQWKDEAEFERGLALGILDAAWEKPVRAEADRIRDEISSQMGIFSPEWDDWVPPPAWGPIDVDDF